MVRIDAPQKIFLQSHIIETVKNLIIQYEEFLYISTRMLMFSRKNDALWTRFSQHLRNLICRKKWVVKYNGNPLIPTLSEYIPCILYYLFALQKPLRLLHILFFLELKTIANILISDNEFIWMLKIDL